MGASLSSWFGALFGAAEKRKILLLGCDNAGKTTLLHFLTTGSLGAFTPTGHPQHQTFRVGAKTLFETFEFGGVSISAIDMGGHASARRLWKTYMLNVDGIVFVVDASDRERLAEARQEVANLLVSLGDTDEAKDASSTKTSTTKTRSMTTPVVILGNKCDRSQALSRPQLIDALGITDLVPMTENERLAVLMSKSSAAVAATAEQVRLLDTSSGVARGDFKQQQQEEKRGDSKRWDEVSARQQLSFATMASPSRDFKEESSSSASESSQVDGPPLLRAQVFMCSVARNFGVQDGFRWLKEAMVVSS